MAARLKKTLWGTVTAVSVMLAMVIAFAYLVGISKMDVTVKHDMARHVVAEPFEAGDIVGLSPDGQRLEGFICDLNLDADNTSGTPIQARYYNVVDEVQDDFFHFVSNVKGALNLGNGPADPLAAKARGISTGLDFTGEVSRVVGSIEARMSEACWCEVGRAVLEQKQHACVVEKALVESEITETPEGTMVRKTVGLSFRPNAISIVDVEALAAACPNLNAGAIAPVAQTCEGKSGVTLDAVARVRVGLIREAPLP